MVHENLEYAKKLAFSAVAVAQEIAIIGVATAMSAYDVASGAVDQHFKPETAPQVKLAVAALGIIGMGYAVKKTFDTAYYVGESVVCTIFTCDAVVVAGDAGHPLHNEL